MNEPETPSYLDPASDCICGHDYEDHIDGEIDFQTGISEIFESDCKNCTCKVFRPKDTYYYEELRQEAELARWEDR